MVVLGGGLSLMSEVPLYQGSRYTKETAIRSMQVLRIH